MNYEKLELNLFINCTKINQREEEYSEVHNTEFEGKIYQTVHSKNRAPLNLFSYQKLGV